MLTKGVPQGCILGRLLCNIFINDMFLFIENCRLCNHADDNSLQSSSENLVYKKFTQANPDKFHFMLFSPTPTEQQVLLVCDGTSLMSETEVTVLGVMI